MNTTSLRVIRRLAAAGVSAMLAALCTMPAAAQLARDPARLTAPPAATRPLDQVCAPSSGTWNLTVKSVQVSGQFLLNGVPFPLLQTQSADFFLVDTTHADEVRLGRSTDGTFSTRVLPGHYNVVYRHYAGTAVPQNKNTVVMRDVAIVADRSLAIDVPAVRVTGAMTLNRAPFPPSFLEAGRLSLWDAASGSAAPLGKTEDQQYVAWVIRGRYGVLYEHAAGSGIAPLNKARLLDQTVTLAVNQTLDIDVPAVTVTARFLLNGAAPPASALENGRIGLVDKKTGSVTLIGSTKNQIAEFVLIPGAYKVQYEGIAGGAIVPQNQKALLPSEVLIGKGGSLDVDIPSVWLTGTFLLDGAAAPPSPLENGRLVLAGGEDRVDVGQSKDAAFAVKVVPGTYVMVWEHLAGGGLVPHNDGGFIANLLIKSDTHQVVALNTAVLHGRVTLNGAEHEFAPGGAPKVSVEDPVTGSLTDLAVGADGRFWVKLLRGNYVVRYTHGSDPALPLNQKTVVGTVSLPHVFPTVIDIASMPLAGSITHNGNAFPNTQADSGNLTLRSPVDDGVIVVGRTTQATLAAKVIPGVYEAHYRRLIGPTVPGNTDATFDCRTLVMP